MPQKIEAIDETSMTFGDHLDELRRRLIHGLIGVGLATAASLFFGQSIIAWLLVPLNRAQRGAGLPAMTVGHNVTTGFMIYLKVSIIAGLIIGSPWLIYQLWRFVSTGLYANERRVVVVLTPFSALLSALGVAFTYYIMLPLCLAFLIGFSASYPVAGGTNPTFLDRITKSVSLFSGLGDPEDSGGIDAPADPANGSEAAPDPAPAVMPAAEGVVLIPILTQEPANPVEGQVWINADRREMKVHFRGRTLIVNLATGALVTPLIDVEGYIGFVTVMILGVVVAFQLPLVMLVVGWTGVVDPALVARYRGYCIFGCFGLGAILTPADIISMVTLAIPLWVLFEVGLILMRRVYPKQA